MISVDTNQLPVVVTTGANNFTMYIPDLHVTVEGSDYVELYARAAVCASAILYYNKEHNLTTTRSTDFDKVQSMCEGKKDQFPAFLGII